MEDNCEIFVEKLVKEKLNKPQDCFRCWMSFAAYPIWIFYIFKNSDWRK